MFNHEKTALPSQVPCAVAFLEAVNRRYVNEVAVIRTLLQDQQCSVFAIPGLPDHALRLLVIGEVTTAEYSHRCLSGAPPIVRDNRLMHLHSDARHEHSDMGDYPSSSCPYDGNPYAQSTNISEGSLPHFIFRENINIEVRPAYPGSLQNTFYAC